MAVKFLLKLISVKYDLIKIFVFFLWNIFIPAAHDYDLLFLYHSSEYIFQILHYMLPFFCWDIKPV